MIAIRCSLTISTDGWSSSTVGKVGHMTRPSRGAERKTFFSGVLLLTASTVSVKLIGLLYKIPMLSYLGSEGMGYFHSAYEIYALFCIIATAGLPVALSVLISSAVTRGEGGEVKRIYRGAMGVFLLIGLGGSLIMAACSELFCEWIRSSQAKACILSISPTVFFICVSSALRGYFQGFQRMLPTALSQLIEAIGKLVFGLLFADMTRRGGGSIAEIAASAGWGLTLGSALSTLYLIGEKLRFRPKLPEGGRSGASIGGILGELGRLALPMTLGASLVSIIKLIDMTMILRRLQAIGYSEAVANEMYGSYTTLALSVFALLPSLLNSVALPLVPLLSSAIASGDREGQQHMIRLSYRITAFFAIPASLGITAFSEPILKLLFGGEPQAVEIAAPLLSLLGVSVFLSCMITAINSVLHAYRVVNRPILATLSGAACKLALAYWLIGTPRIGMLGAPISTFACNGLIVLICFVLASKCASGVSVGEVFLRPLLCSAVSIGGAYGLYYLLFSRFGESGWIFPAVLVMAVISYLVLAFLWGAIEEEDLAAIPACRPLCRLLRCLQRAKCDRRL